MRDSDPVGYIRYDFARSVLKKKSEMHQSDRPMILPDILPAGDPANLKDGDRKSVWPAIGNMYILNLRNKQR